MSNTRFSVHARQDDPRRVVVNLQGGTGTASHEFAPLEAIDLCGKLMAAALELLVGDGRLGVPTESVGPLVLWENWGTPDNGAGWCPQFLSTIHDIQSNIARCRQDGTPYRLTLPVISDPLEPPTEKG